jgi:serine/threonine-protein kinase
MWLLVLLAIVLLGAIGFLGAQILGGLTPGNGTPSPSVETIEMPDWVGDPITQVRREAEDLGLDENLREEREFSEDVEEGRVIRTDPEAGEEVAQGDRVTVVVSRGAEEVEVPRLIGQTEQQATETLRGVGLELGQVTREPSSEEAGRVIRSSPPEGVSVSPGDQVDIVLSSGPTPSPTPSPTPEPTATPVPPTPTPVPETPTPEPTQEP